MLDRQTSFATPDPEATLARIASLLPNAERLGAAVVATGRPSSWGIRSRLRAETRPGWTEVRVGAEVTGDGAWGWLIVGLLVWPLLLVAVFLAWQEWDREAERLLLAARAAA